MIDKALTAGLAGVWLWAVLNDDEGVVGDLHNELAKRHNWNKWMKCPWCSGAWFAGSVVAVIGQGSLRDKLATSLAAAGITGIVGSYLEGAV